MFVYDGLLYWTEEQAEKVIMEKHPELGDDALIEYFESHVEEVNLIEYLERDTEYE